VRKLLEVARLNAFRRIGDDVEVDIILVCSNVRMNRTLGMHGGTVVDDTRTRTARRNRVRDPCPRACQMFWRR